MLSGKCLIHDRSCNGVTLLEFCLTLTLSLLVVTGGLVSLERAGYWYSQLRKEIESEKIFMELHVILERVFSAIETGVIPGQWKIHQNGAFRYSDNSTHPIQRLQGTSQPRNWSDGISIVELAPQAIGSVSSASRDFVTVCPVTNTQPKVTQVHSFLHLSILGIEQRTTGGVGEGITWPTVCSRIGGTRMKGMFADITAPEVSGQAVIPILKEYSLFIDRSSHLRLVSHRGGWLRENQPLVDGIRSLAFSESQHNDVTVLSVTGRTLAGRTRTWSRPLRIVRRTWGLEDVF